MEGEQTDAPQVLETGEHAEGEQQQIAETTEEPKVSLTQKELDDLKAKATKAEELESKNKQLFERNKKLAAEKKEQEGLTSRDAMALMGAGITEDSDIELVQEFASFKKIPIKDALANSTIKGMLQTAAEERRTAAATQINARTRGTAQTSGADLLAKAEATGEVPDTDEGMQELFKARLARKLKK